MPILNPNAIEFFSNSAEQSKRMGIQLGALLKAGDMLCLEGELGAGKTTLVQGIVAGWGSPDLVTSPTYVLVNMYSRADKAKLIHMDAYRLKDAKEAEELDLEVLLEQGPFIVEWADKIEAALPEERLWLKMYWVEEERRRIEISSQGKRFEFLIEEFQEAIFGLL
jgi:tRNA threonylcarbamoyladenosine biosynthesis protein TsaE